MAPSSFYVLLAASAATGIATAALAAWALTRGGDRVRTLTLPRLLVVGGVAGAALGVKLPLLAALGLNVFGRMHAAYVELVAVGPAVSAGLLLLHLRTRRVHLSGAAALALLGAGTAALAGGAYGTLIEPAGFRVETATVVVPAARAGAEPLRVGVLADLQTPRAGDREGRAVERLLAARPDVILIPGDLFQGWPGTFERRAEGLRRLLGRLAAPAGVYFVVGDYDTPETVGGLLAGLDITVLDGRQVTVSHLDRRLTIAGLPLDCTGPAARAAIGRLEQAPGDDDIRLLVAHRPDAMLAMSAGSRIDLLVAGHTHGGQVRLPWVGPPVTFSAVPRSVAAGGLHDVDGRRVYVSRGLGHERGQAPRLRFLCPPEVSLITIADRSGATGGTPPPGG